MRGNPRGYGADSRCLLSALGSHLHKRIARTSTTPITIQMIALTCSPANQNPLAALKQRIALVHPLTNAPGLLNISRSFIGVSYRRKRPARSNLYRLFTIFLGAFIRSVMHWPSAPLIRVLCERVGFVTI